MGSLQGEILSPRMLINGELVEASDKKTFELFNPASGQKIADVPEATEDDTNAAVAAAKAAFKSWSQLAPATRGGYLKKLAELVRQNSDELGRIEAISMGRPVATFSDAAYTAPTFDLYAESWPHMQGITSLNTPGHVGMTLRQPFGVVAAILPWNGPSPLFAHKVGPALIAGNTVVVKSSERAPLAIAMLGDLARQAGFPPGVINVLSGHGQTSGALLARHMDVRALSFTGSTRTGRSIQEAAAKSNLKKVMLELGGKSPSIVFADADLEKAARETSFGIRFNSGQVCFANSRLYVEKSVAPQFIRLFKEACSDETKGDPLDPKTTRGPQVDKMQYDVIMSYIESGKTSGAELVLGGKGLLEDKGGFFIEPTVFVSTPEDARIMKEEIFGPVISINTFETEDEVVAKANDTEYGLYASVYTRDLSRAMRIVKALESGYVAVNCTTPSLVLELPFGGYKSSGQGREGFSTVEEWLETKSVLIKLD